MSYAEVIVNQALAYLMVRFEEAREEAALMVNFNQFNTDSILLLNFELIHTGQMPAPTMDKIAFQCAEPQQAEVDLWATNRISQSQLEYSSSPQPSAIQQHPISQTYLPPQTTKSREQIMEQLSAKDGGLFALSEPQPTPQQLQFQRQISGVKKNFFARLKIKREMQEEERRRGEQLKNRKAPESPTQDFCFDYNGSLFMRKKSMMRTNLALRMSSNSGQIEEKLMKKRDEDESFRYCLDSRGSGSRQTKRLLFNNAGKRQKSHLPFIKLTQSNKLTQNNRVMYSDPSKYTLKSMHSRGDSSFRHFAQIQKERTERLYSLRRSEVSWSETSAEENASDSPLSSHPQSKRMQKYLKKLCQDRNKDVLSQLNRSSNFDLTNSPHDPPLGRYYRHNYDEDKSNICESSLVSLRLHRGRGHFTQPTQLTQMDI